MKASQNGDVISKFELWECFYYGYGTREVREKALELYQRAIKTNKESNIALYRLAEYYKYIGDELDAYIYYEKAAKDGFVQSQYSLAECYRQGIGIPEVDIAKAFEFI